jgi:hypothetical protein
MPRSSVMFTKDWMVNDCSSHYLQGQSIKRTVSEQVVTRFREVLPDKTAVCASGMEFAISRFVAAFHRKGVGAMKRLLIFILIWSFLVLTGTVLSAEGRARTNFDKLIENQWRQTDVIR